MWWLWEGFGQEYEQYWLFGEQRIKDGGLCCFDVGCAVWEECLSAAILWEAYVHCKRDSFQVISMVRNDLDGLDVALNIRV